MNKSSFIGFLCKRYPALKELQGSIETAARAVTECYSKGGKLMVCGNGGSSSEADHLVGELMKSFESERPLEDYLKNRLIETDGVRGKYLAMKLERGLPAISLSSQTALTTAILNDIDGDLVFAQQVNVYGTEKDILIAISCSGNSQNVVDACITARALNIKTIGLTGHTGGKMKQFCDILINVPETRTALVQELHLPVLHTLCRIVENDFYGHSK